MDETNNIIDFYNQTFEKFGENVRTLDWGSEKTQLLRFTVLAEIGDLNGKSILDVGCGFADLYDFLKDRFINIKYTGIEITTKVFEIAKKKHPELDLRLLDILNDPIDNFDYVLASGIHTVKTGNNYEFALKMIRKMFDICNTGIATNMISAQPKETAYAEHVYAFQADKILGEMLKLTDYAVIRHDYLPHDFTVYLYKKDYNERKSLK
jgi:SAM-dependent methyltransferase